jgi:hypothetical protein
VKKKQQEKQKNHFGKDSGLIPCVSNPGTGTYDWGFLNVSVSSQGWYSVEKDAAPLC